MIKAIETRYAGYRFRSRLEARWAVFFDAMGIKYEYEREGYHLPSGCYLPDFWLPQVSMFAEVKPEKFSIHEIALCVQLSQQSEHAVLMLDGMPRDISYIAVESVEYEHGGWMAQLGVYDIQEGHRYWECESRFYWDNGGCLDCGCERLKPFPAAPISPEYVFEFIERDTSHANHAAISAARSARFEHGECG